MKWIGGVASVLAIGLGAVWGLSTTGRDRANTRSHWWYSSSRTLGKPAGRGEGRKRSPRGFLTGGTDALEHRELLSGVVAGILAPMVVEVSSAEASPSTPTLHELADDTFLATVLYGTPNRMASSIAPSGAVGVNSDFEEGLATKWYIELQRYGADFVQAGLVTQNADLVDRGWKILDWGFARQGGDGGFPETVDAFHSTSLFVEGASRALLLTVQSQAADAPERMADYLPKIDAAANWLLDPTRASQVEIYQSRYTHRRWLLAAGLGQAAALARLRAVTDATGNWSARAKTLADAAGQYAEMGLAMQAPDGMNPEKGGGDVSYQIYGAMMAQRYLTTCTNPTLSTRVRQSIIDALRWAEDFIAPDGTVSLEGSTRTGVETTRGGTPKSIDYKTIVQSFSMATTLTGDPHYREIAKAVASGRGWYRP